MHPGPLWYIYPDLNNRHCKPDMLSHAKEFLGTLDGGMKLLDVGQAKTDPASFTTTAQHIIELLFDAAEPCNPNICAAAETDWRKGANTEAAVLIVMAQIGFGLLSIGSTTTNKVEARQAADIGTPRCGAAGIVRARQLLFDVQKTDDISQFRLRFAAMLVRYGIGSAALVQSSDNLVHNPSVDGLQLNGTVDMMRFSDAFRQ